MCKAVHAIVVLLLDESIMLINHTKQKQEEEVILIPNKPLLAITHLLTALMYAFSTDNNMKATSSTSTQDELQPLELSAQHYCMPSIDLGSKSASQSGRSWGESNFNKIR